MLFGFQYRVSMCVTGSDVGGICSILAILAILIFSIFFCFGGDSFLGGFWSSPNSSLAVIEFYFLFSVLINLVGFFVEVF